VSLAESKVASLFHPSSFVILALSCGVGGVYRSPDLLIESVQIDVLFRQTDGSGRESAILMKVRH